MLIQCSFTLKKSSRSALRVILNSMATSPAIVFDTVQKSFMRQEDRTLKDLVPSLVRGRGFGTQHHVLNDLSFTIKKGETVGIIGRNGAGKSTLLKLIAGVTYPSSGNVEVHGKVAPLIELGAGFHHELSGHENIYLNAALLGMSKTQIDERIDSIIEFSGLEEFINTPIKRYSSGMYMRLGFSVAIHTDAPILLIDEVLAVGDLEFQNKCLEFLSSLKKNPEKTIVFVSHNDKAIEEFCDRVIFLNEGRVEHDGSPRDSLKKYHATLDIT